MSKSITIVRLSPKIRLAGMFAVINYFVDFLCDILKKDPEAEFHLTLDNYQMYQEKPGEDVFLYYFEPTSLMRARNSSPEVQVPIKCRPSIAPRGAMTTIGRDNARELLPPKSSDRGRISKVINRFFRLNTATRQRLEDFKKKHFEGVPVIGVHLRGAGRLDGGTKKFKKGLLLEDGVPYQAYFQKIDAYLQTHPNARIFICSDSQRVIDRIHRQYPEQTFHYDSQLTDFGESHIASQKARASGQQSDLNPRKLGEDVILEAWLLSTCDYFVHGNSNISNFIICLNPELVHDDIYESTYSSNLRGWRRLAVRIRSLGYWWVSAFRRAIGRVYPRWGCPE